MKYHPHFRFTVYMLLVVVLANMAVIDYFLYQRQHTYNSSQLQTLSYTAKKTAAPSPADTGCDKNCVQSLEEKIKTATQSLTFTNPQPISSSQNKDYYIPLGSGLVTSDGWMNQGAQAYIDISNYQNVKQIKFEAIMNIPTGNGTVFARLYNQNDNHPVWYSDISTTSVTSALVISQPIVMDPGNKLYIVQMRSSLGFEADMTQARVHVMTN